MISLPLYKQGLKAGWKILVILAAVMAMYITIIITMFDPQLGAALQGLAQAMPEIMAIAGMTYAGTSLCGFIASYLYGFVALVFPMVFSIIMANRLVCRHIDRGSMAYLLAAPVSRATVAFTQLKALGTGIFALMAFMTAAGGISAELWFPGQLEWGSFLLLNLGALALHAFIGAICFFASCLFSESKHSLALGAGLPSLMFVLQMIANYGGRLSNFRYATFFTLFDSAALAEGSLSALWGVAALAAGAAGLNALSIYIFTKRDIQV